MKSESDPNGAPCHRYSYNNLSGMVERFVPHINGYGNH